MTPIAMLSVGSGEILLVAFVALLVFGGRLPEVMHNLGRSYAKFKQGLEDATTPLRNEIRGLDARTSKPRPKPPARGTKPASETTAAPEATEGDAPRPAPTEPPPREVPRTRAAGAADEPPPV